MAPTLTRQKSQMEYKDKIFDKVRKKVSQKENTSEDGFAGRILHSVVYQIQFLKLRCGTRSFPWLWNNVHTSQERGKISF